MPQAPARLAPARRRSLLVRRASARLFDLGIPLVSFVLAGPMVRRLLTLDDRATGFVIGGVALVIYWLYETALTAHRGQTWGKRLAGVRVTTSDGARPPLTTSALRALPVLLFGVPGLWLLVPLAYGWCLLDRSTRGLHDLVAGTHVTPLRWLDGGDVAVS